jgi:hypothetical protein
MNRQRFSKYSIRNASTPEDVPLQRGTDTSAQSPSTRIAASSTAGDEFDEHDDAPAVACEDPRPRARSLVTVCTSPGAPRRSRSFGDST